MAKYAGTYFNSGYGSITFCNVSNLLNSTYCTKVIAGISAVDPQLLGELTMLFPEGYGNDQTSLETVDSAHRLGAPKTPTPTTLQF